MEAIEMRFRNIVCLTLGLITSALLPAANVWNPTDPNDIAAGFANWNVAANWTLGVPTDVEKDPLKPENQTGKAVFSVSGAVECRVDQPVSCYQFAMGDNGSAPYTNQVRVLDGGSITTVGGQWAAVSYNRPATLIVENGGSCSFDNHLWICTTADAVGRGNLIVDGGTVSVNGSFRIGNGPAIGSVTIDKGGTLDVARAESVFIQPGSVMDIRFGTFIIHQDRRTDLQTYLADGRLTAFGGAGTINMQTIGGTTYVTANDPMLRSPAFTTILASSSLSLAWTNLAPVAPATDVWVDVWFGTDPNKLGSDYAKVLTQAKNATTVTVDASLITEPSTRYYWQIDSYLLGDPAIVDYSDPNFTPEGDLVFFDVVNNTPPSVAIETVPTMTWINMPVQLDSTVIDDHPEEVTYLWTSDDPNAVFLPSNTVADPTVTMDYHSAQFRVTVTVEDGFNPPASASVTLDCAANPCQGANALGFGEQHPADIVGDCRVDLDDFAAIAREWLTDYALTEPAPIAR